MQSSGLAQLLHAAKHRCYYCKREMILSRGQPNTVTRDHKVPRSRGGRGAANIVAACARCNNVKGNMTDTEFFAFIQANGLQELCLGLLNASQMLAKRRDKAALRLRQRVAQQEQAWHEKGNTVE
jgi:HNH endonuclease